MDRAVEITGKEWSDINEKVNGNQRQIEFNTSKLNRHSTRLEKIEQQQISLPLSIQKAVENGMAPVLEKVLNHDRRFSELEVEKEREEKEKALKEIEESKEKNRWFFRAMVGAAITAAVSGVVGFYIAVFLNNLGG